MKNFLISMTALLLASAPCSADNTKWRTEKLTRGVVAIPQSSSGSSYLVSWRMLDTDDDYTTFDVIKNGTVVKSDINSPGIPYSMPIPRYSLKGYSGQPAICTATSALSFSLKNSS